MSELATPACVPHLLAELRDYARLCEEILDLQRRENQSLRAPEQHQPFTFYRGRKDLISRLDAANNAFRHWRQHWQQIAAHERARQIEVNEMFQVVQDLVLRVLLLDRENQQSLLRRGLLPANDLPSVTSQQPHLVASVYRRHALP